MLERPRGEAILKLIIQIELSRFRSRKEVTRMMSAAAGVVA